jgi:hypothetical protein
MGDYSCKDNTILASGCKGLTGQVKIMKEYVLINRISKFGFRAIGEQN